MGKTIPIQLSIPNPCSENWDEMNVSEKGRFCKNCQKDVIDFTKWNDADLHMFFEKNQEGVCGRVYSYQLNRPISIPVQPHSILYRMAISLGLTLLIAQTPGYARKMPPLLEQNVVEEYVYQEANDSTSNSNIIRIIVTDEKKEPVIGALCRLMDTCTGQYILGFTTDIDGRFTLRLGADEVLNRDLVLEVHYIGYLRQRLVIVQEYYQTDLKIRLEIDKQFATRLYECGGLISRPVKMQDPFIPGMNTTITGEDMKHMGGN